MKCFQYEWPLFSFYLYTYDAFAHTRQHEHMHREQRGTRKHIHYVRTPWFECSIIFKNSYAWQGLKSKRNRHFIMTPPRPSHSAIVQCPPWKAYVPPYWLVKSFLRSSAGCRGCARCLTRCCSTWQPPLLMPRSPLLSRYYFPSYFCFFFCFHFFFLFFCLFFFNFIFSKTVVIRTLNRFCGKYMSNSVPAHRL